MTRYFCLLCNTIMLWVIFCLITSNSAKIVNIYVNRSIDITTPTVNETTVIFFINDGSTPVSTYTFLLNPEIRSYYIKFTNINKQQLHFSESLKDKNAFTVYLDRTLGIRDSYELNAIIYLANSTKPRFKEITMGERQVLHYRENIYFYSAYKTKKLKVGYNCAVESYCTASYLPHLMEKNTIFYYYVNVVPYSTKNIDIYFEYREPLIAVENLVRTLDISHWGQILVEDRVTLRAIGASLKGPYEPQLNTSRAWLYTRLPLTAQNVKYFDEIGNNSKSELEYNEDSITFLYQTRYPLIFGGWKASYVLQYTIPTYEYLQKHHQLFRLRMEAIYHVTDYAVIEKALVQILFPEGAIIKKVKSPKWSNTSENIHFTNLCLLGRKTVELYSKMLVEGDILEDVEIIYEVSNLWLLKSPILISIYLQVVFIFIISINRLM